MHFKKIDKKDIQEFQDLFGKEYVLFQEDLLVEYSHDETDDLSFLPEVVV